MKDFNMINALETVCPFPTAFQEIENPGKGISRYRRELGYIRAEYDGRKWHNSIHQVHDHLGTLPMCHEIDAVYDTLISEHMFPGLKALRSFCAGFPQARANRDGDYDFYLEGALCWYWLRLVTRDKDYNLYLHAFLKETEPVAQAYFDFLDESINASLPALMDAFPTLTEDQASAILWRWQKRFRALKK